VVSNYLRSRPSSNSEGSLGRSRLTRHTAAKTSKTKRRTSKVPTQQRGQYANLFGGNGAVTVISTPRRDTDENKAAEEARPASKSPTWAKRLRVIVGSLLVVAVLIAAGVGTVALTNGSWSVNPVLSGSMRPGVAVGGVVISERVPVSELMVRDVIVFRRPDKPSEQLVHRIIKIAKGSSGQFLINTQGDANTIRDPWTLTIRGKYAYRVRWSLPLIGYVAVAFENNRGVALLAAGLVLIIFAVFEVVKSLRREKANAKLDV
jgi:signal peptidase I